MRVVVVDGIPCITVDQATWDDYFEACRKEEVTMLCHKDLMTIGLLNLQAPLIKEKDAQIWEGIGRTLRRIDDNS